MKTLLLIAGLILAAIAVAALVAWLHRRRTLSRLAVHPSWELVYADDPRKKGAKLLAVGTDDAHVVGRPDRVYRLPRSKEAVIVEDKSRPMPRFLYASHRAQLGAYVLLVEGALGLTVTRALVRYSDGTREIPVDDDLRRDTHDVLSEMAHVDPAHLFRNHDEKGRCRRCPHRRICGQSLWTDDIPQGDDRGGNAHL